MRDDLSSKYDADASLRALVQQADLMADWPTRPSPPEAFATLQSRLGVETGKVKATPDRAVREPFSRVRDHQAGSSALRSVVYAIGGAAACLAAWFMFTTSNTQPAGISEVASYSTQAGERATVTLGDGTRVTLAPDTRISVKGRTVNLSGEALFTVSHSARDAFAVVVRNTRTTVLGTTFAIRAYDNDPAVRVAVTEGRVQVDAGDPDRAQRETRVLNASDAVIADGAMITPLASIDLSAVLGWTQGKLVWQRAAASDVVRDINRTYNLHLTLSAPSLERREITAVFPSMSVTELLDELSLLLNAKYARDGSRIVFTPR